MTANIKSIRMWDDNPDKTRVSKVVRIEFKFPCTWTVLSIEELKQILRVWIKGEELKYPTRTNLYGDTVKGRSLLFEEIIKVFEEDL